jgi:hypothetical protein
MRNDLQIIIDTMGRINPAHILRSVQLICYACFNQCRARLPTCNPDFANILHCIILQSYVLPHLPPALFKLAYPQPLPTFTPKLPGSTSGSTIATVPTVTSLLSTAIAGDVSVLTSPTLQTRLAPVRGTFQANLTPDSTL